MRLKMVSDSLQMKMFLYLIYISNTERKKKLSRGLWGDKTGRELMRKNGESRFGKGK